MVSLLAVHKTMLLEHADKARINRADSKIQRNIFGYNAFEEAAAAAAQLNR